MHKFLYRSLTVFLLFLLFSGCTPVAFSSAADTPFVDLSNLEPLEPPTDDDIVPLHVAISAVISPQGSVESYSPLIALLEETLQRPVVVEQRRTYAEVNRLVEEGKVDMAFVCTSQYLAGREDFGMQLLAAPQVGGETVYRASLIVPFDSPAESMEDLRWKVFAFTDPISFTGRIYPTYLLQQMGTDPESFFARTFYTYSHDDAIYAVADRVANGASVDSVVLDFALQRDPELASRIRVIHTSPDFGIPPVVIGPHVRPQLREQLQSFLLGLHLTPEGREALKALSYDRFVLISDETYDSAHVVEELTGITIESAP